jgi:hypothetical protein
VTTTEAQSVALDPRFLESLDPAQVGAAASKLFAASVGDIVVVLSRSPAHKHYSLADTEWMVPLPVVVCQFYGAGMPDKHHVLVRQSSWSPGVLVPEEFDKPLENQAMRLLRLRPDEWDGCYRMIDRRRANIESTMAVLR